MQTPAKLIQQAVVAFNAEAFRDALLGFEAAWHTERSESLRVLILLSNTLNQLRHGLITAPRANLATAARLLAEECPATIIGMPTERLQQYVAQLQALIPPDLETGAAVVPWEQIPRLRLEITPRKGLV